jgi:hypothetical protein
MRAAAIGCLAVLCCSIQLHAQAGPPAVPDSIVIAAAVAPLPEEFRTSATVLSYRSGGGLGVLRQASGAYICLADDPSDDRFHVACYHRTLEPFMARGRELRAQGFTEQVDSIREAEARDGRLRMPVFPAALFSLTAPPEGFDAATGAITGAQPLHVVYIPFATVELTGLPATPLRNAPWLMYPGTARAHIMFVPEMRR